MRTLPGEIFPSVCGFNIKHFLMVTEVARLARRAIGSIPAMMFALIIFRLPGLKLAQSPNPPHIKMSLADVSPPNRECLNS
jgi:hypothetical protein